MTSNNNTDCSGTTLLRNPYGETYTYFISMTGGSGDLSHNKISKIVQNGNYEQFIIHFIDGMKHQAFYHTGKDNLITDQVINDISGLIGSIFSYYTEKPAISVDNYDNIIKHFNIKKTGLNAISLNVINELLSNLQHNQYEEAVASIILYIDDNAFTLSQTIINRFKSDIIVLINQLNTDVVTFDSKKVNTIIRP